MLPHARQLSQGRSQVLLGVGYVARGRSLQQSADLVGFQPRQDTITGGEPEGGGVLGDRHPLTSA